MFLDLRNFQHAISGHSFWASVVSWLVDKYGGSVSGD
jgi:hypothetical protein